MNRKKKICKVCQNEDYIFSKGRCKCCAQKDYAKTTKENQITKAKTAPKNNFRPTERHKIAKDAERVAMAAFWNVSKDINDNCHCEECKMKGVGSSVGSDFNPYNVAHIISKGSNPAFRCDLRNYIILCAEHHNEFDGGRRTEMMVYEKTEAIRQKLRNEDSEKL